MTIKRHAILFSLLLLLTICAGIVWHFFSSPSIQAEQDRYPSHVSSLRFILRAGKDPITHSPNGSDWWYEILEDGKWEKKAAPSGFKFLYQIELLPWRQELIETSPDLYLGNTPWPPGTYRFVLPYDIYGIDKAIPKKSGLLISNPFTIEAT